MNQVDSRAKQFPPQIKYIVGNEACERFSFYGMKSILVVFMVQNLLMSAQKATTVYHLFSSAVYLLPLLGAFLSDRFFGKYKTIIGLSLVYCAGHAVLSLWENEAGMYWGLALIALGSGGIKPCVSAHVGDQFNAETQQDLISQVFSLFYWMINFGAFFSTLLIPSLLRTYGPSVAFGIPGVLMFIATFVFWLGRNQYVHVPPSRGTGEPGFITLLFKSDRTPKQKEELSAVLDLFKVFAFVSVFWALFDQSGSTWVLQGQRMNLDVFGFRIEPAQIGAVNPIMVMLLIPFFSKGVYPLVEKLGIRVTPLRKMSVGMVLAGLSFAMIGVFEKLLDSGVSLNISWQVLPYLVITCSEVMVSITGLEFAYAQSPKSMKSTMMSFWLVTVFFGNLLTAWISQLNPFQGATYFHFYALLMFGVSILFSIGAARYKVRSF